MTTTELAILGGVVLATLLLSATLIIVLIALATLAHAPAGHHIKTISIIGSGLLLVVYSTWMWRYIRSDEGPGEGTGRPRLNTLVAAVLLAVAGAASAF